MSSVTLFEGIELLSGAYMDYKHPEQSDATIEDIGHALSNVCRFAGHLPRFYSVAQHGVNVAAVVKALGGDTNDEYEGLMHDTAEAFTNDLPTPLKVAFPIFKELETAIEAAMAKRFKFGYPYSYLVKKADLIMLGLEKVHVKGCTAEWACLEGIDFEQYRPFVNLSKMIPARAYDNFMDAYEGASTLSKDYIIQKAVEIAKVKTKLRLSLAEYGERYWAFRKYDGCCAVLYDGRTFSRTGEEYQCLNEVSARLEREYPDYVFIGEAWWPGKDQFNLISGEFRRQQVSDKLMFMVHDVIPRDDFFRGICMIPFMDRWKGVLVDGLMDNRIQEASGWGPGRYGDPQTRCNEVMDEGGYDGLVLRDPAGTWTVGSGTTGEIVKVKRKLSFDLRVLEVNTATGDKTGRTVYKLVVDFNGLRLGVGSGVPHKLCDVPVVGDIVEVEAMDYSSDGLLREPRFKGVRFDKLEPDV